MTAMDSASRGILVIPRLRVQNANAVSSPLTHGFPSITAFLGLMWALDRKMAAAGIPLVPEKVGVICHWYEEQTQDGYVKAFRLTRNPVDRNGSTAAIVEEGRIHLELTLIFQVDGGDVDNANNLLVHADDEQRRRIAWQVRDLISTMRLAGGTVVPGQSVRGTSVTPQLLLWSESEEESQRVFRYLRRKWLPGFVLVSRNDLLQQRLQQLRVQTPEASLLDAWLDLARFNHRSELDAQNKVVWKHDRPQGSGWIVPIPVGYGALSQLYESGQVLNARDSTTPFRFVETLYSIGQWISPYRLQRMQDMFWWSESQLEHGAYLCRNDYTPPLADAGASDISPPLLSTAVNSN